MGGTPGSGIVSSAADVLWMSVVRGIRGVGGVCISTELVPLCTLDIGLSSCTLDIGLSSYLYVHWILDLKKNIIIR